MTELTEAEEIKLKEMNSEIVATRRRLKELKEERDQFLEELEGEP